MNTIPVCMFPTKVLLIDDDISSLENLELNLDDSKFAYQFYYTPQEALTFLTKAHRQNSFEKRLVCQPDEMKWQHAVIDVNIYDLMKEIYNPKRFESVSTVVVDFSMPGMNGLEVCEKITDPSIQKILLTGEGDENLAVEAFNKGLIHRYIKKQDPDVIPLLNQSLGKAQRAYFSKISQLMFDVATFSAETSCLRDPLFIHFFENLLKEKDIIEYYLFEITGSFLLIDQDENFFGLFTYNKEQLNMWHEDMPERETAPPYLLKDLKDYKKMICFHDKDRISIPSGSQWEKYSYPLHMLEGKEGTYFYACARNMVDIEPTKFSSFKNYKKEFYQNFPSMGLRG